MFVLENAQVEEGAARAAGWLQSVGVGEGERVAVVAENEPWFVPLVMGALRTGVVPVPINVHLEVGEQQRIIEDADVSLVVRDEPGDAEPVDLAPWPRARPMHYTSGTTGLAKGVWSGLLSDEEAAALVADEADLWAAGEGDTVLVCSPLYHSAPLRIAMSSLLHGGRAVIFERFDAHEIAQAFINEKITGAFLVPTHLRRLLALNDFAAPHAKRILHAGEPCPDELKLRAIDVFGADVLSEFYGSTEGQFTYCTSAEWLDHRGTVGRARTGRTLRIDDDGAIWATVPSFARWEYWRDEAKTKAAWRGDEFTVRDLGRLDDDGYLYIDGRREDLIISGGVNVYPAEVERVLLSFPDIGEVAVYGVDDPDWGQRVCAAFTGGVDPDAVKAFARERLPGSHAPKSIVHVDALPRTATGKVRRAELREAH